ncbi:MAG: homoserine dehydrogenase [Luteimonas sp.]
MVAVPEPVVRRTRAPARVVLLGTGNVGSAVLARLSAWGSREPGRQLHLAAIANTRALRTTGLHDESALPGADAGYAARAVRILGDRGVRIVLDATASEAIAEHHAAWLAAGIHVVTACKLGQGAALTRWHAIRDACVRGGTHYGDSATVGAGLPLLRSVRDLRAGGDHIRGIAGVLSGSLAWLFGHYDGSRPFAALVDEAHALGYTEPDPRIDLSGEDVRRKLLILARTAGIVLEDAGVLVEAIDSAGVQDRYAQALADGRLLAHVARLQCLADGSVSARVGLEALPAADPLAAGTGTNNRVAIWSDRYPVQPLQIQGPGAGADVTAAALLDDALRIAAINTR